MKIPRGCIIPTARPATAKTEPSIVRAFSCQLPYMIVSRTAKTEIALNKSHQTRVRLGRHLSAKVPSINENMNIGANSATEIKETATGLLFVLSITNNNIAKLRNHSTICKKIEENIITWTNRFRKNEDIEEFVIQLLLSSY